MCENRFDGFGGFDGWDYGPDGFDGFDGERECYGRDVIIDRVASKTVPVAVEFKRVHKHQFVTEEPLPKRRLIERPVRRGYGPGYGYRPY
ncbi:MAG: hypothetical protein FWH07_04955 [Oscillospiraceae bacterium]|nr:hypothetical protein [Oscillospiraceae bacterium]